MKSRWPLIAALILLAACTPIRLAKGGSEQPSAVVMAIHSELAARSGREQEEIVRALGARIDRHPRDDNEQFALAEYYFLAYRPRQSMRLFWPFMRRADWRGRHAWQRVMQMEFRAFDRVERVEAMAPDYVARYPYAPDDLVGVSQQIGNLAQYHADRGEHAVAAQIVAAHVRAAPYDAPYAIHGLPSRFRESFTRAGKEGELRALLLSQQAGLTAAMAREPERPWPALSDPAWRAPMSGLIEGRSYSGVRLYGYRVLLDQIEASLSALPED